MEIPVASYARFSSQNQREASIEIQQEHINRFCKENRFTICHEYVDRAQSATTDNRPSFQQMIADASTGAFKAVVVYNTSRFCRNIQDHLKYKAILESYGVKILSVQEGIDDSTPEGSLLNHFMMSINEYYSKDLSRKIYLGCLESAKKGIHVGGPSPFGYTILDDKKYGINEKESEIVRIIFNKVDEGFTYPQVAKYLNENGYRRRDGSKFTPFFYDLLSNRKYIGEYIWNKTKKKDAFGNRVSRLYKDEDEIVRIPHAMPQIIDEDLFNRVQDIIQSRKEIRRTNGKGKFLLSSLLVCDECGFKMSGDRNINGNGKGTFTRLVYKCDSRRRRNNKCSNKPIHAVRLENYVINLINSVLLNTSYAKAIKKMMKVSLGKEHELCHEKTGQLENEIKELKELIENLVQSLSEAKNMAYSEILKAIEKNSRLKLRKEEELSKLAMQISSNPVIHEEIIARRMLKLRKAVSDNKLESMKTLVRLLIKEIRVGKNEIRLTINLNAYLSAHSDKTLTMIIVEKRENIDNVDKQSALALTWSMLNLKTYQSTV